MPHELAATPPPETYNALNPAASASLAAQALMVARVTCKGRLSGQPRYEDARQVFKSVMALGRTVEYIFQDNQPCAGWQAVR